MTFFELKQKSQDVHPALLLEKYLPFDIRRSIRSILFYALIFIFLIILISVYGLKIPFMPTNIALSFANLKLFFRGVFLFALSFWTIFHLLEAMYFSYFFKNIGVDFNVLKIVNQTRPDDLIGGFLRSYIGRKVMKRLGVPFTEVDNFLGKRTYSVSVEEYQMVKDEESDFITFADYGRSLIHFDDQFKYFLSLKKVTPNDFRGALQFVTYVERKKRDQRRWWTRDRLVRIPSLGRSLSLGKVYLLERYGHPIISDTNYINLGVSFRTYQEYIEKLEQILLKKDGANAILISETNDAGMAVMGAFGKAVTSGEIIHEFENYRIFVLDINTLLGVTRDKNEFEIILEDIFKQASKAGNTIVVIPNLSEFIDDINSIGGDAVNLLSKIMESEKVNVVAVSSTHGYHASIETNIGLMKHFDKIAIDEFNLDTVFRLIQNEIVRVEIKRGFFFTYQSVRAIVESAHRYFPSGILIDKALDILNEVVVKLNQEKKEIVEAEDVYDFIEQKTGIPLGELSAVEKEVFINLEDILHKRIVGQDEAVDSISNALRRGRTGIRKGERPIGTFLFIGPTGVGKTETAKALTESFFDGEENLIRFDMSEFAGDDALDRLLGTEGKAGVLVREINDNKYGVLLFDEFEKTNRRVMNLFLQILDEGFFTDKRGEKINVRDFIIIATSNALSDLILEAKYKGEDLSKKKNEIIRRIVGDGIFSAELINRFDDVILFHPLTPDQLKEISNKMIVALNKRLEDKGIFIEITDDLLNHLALTGGNMKFGAREMRRSIQDNLEAKIADGIIKGNIKSGSRIKFIKRGDDYSELDLVVG